MSEPAYVCMECARTTSGRCVQHSYVSIPKQDILSECIALRKRVEELEEHRKELIELVDSRTRGWREAAEKAERERDYEQERNRLNVQQWSEENAKLQAERDEARATKNLHKERYQQSEERAEKAERERDNYRRGFDGAAHACDKLQADLDAALRWIETDSYASDSSRQRVLALLAARKEEKRG